MTRSQWEKKLRKKLSALPADERNRILEYYDELYCDKRDAGLREEEILKEFGPPEDAAARAVEESGAPKRRKGTAGRFFLAAFLFLFVGLPVLLVLAALGVTGAAVFVSGFAVIIAGIADFFYFVAQMCLYGATGAYVAHLGIGLACTGIGCLLIPIFLFLTKKLFILCGKLFAVTARFIRGKREAY